MSLCETLRCKSHKSKNNTSSIVARHPVHGHIHARVHAHRAAAEPVRVYNNTVNARDPRARRDVPQRIPFSLVARRVTSLAMARSLARSCASRAIIPRVHSARYLQQAYSHFNTQPRTTFVGRRTKAPCPRADITAVAAAPRAFYPPPSLPAPVTGILVVTRVNGDT